MFIDEADIVVTAGKGGDGKISFYPMKNGPDGGNGGNGGNVYARLDPTLSNLNKFWERKSYKAGNAMAGGSYRRKGANGEDLFLYFPKGTTLIDKETGHEIELMDESTEVLLCRGGQGGRGNDAFKSSVFQTPRKYETGKEGQVKQFHVILRLIADYGLIGLPNAGKSSLLNELTAANVKTAAYPFTTLEPNLGVVDGKILADIPGLIEGASGGKGLGVKFLKHIEKVDMLLHCIASDSVDVVKDYKTVVDELQKYNPTLLEKEQIILLTKHDLVDANTIKKHTKLLKKFSNQILPLSIHDFESLEALKKLL